MTMPQNDLRLTRAPTMNAGMLVRRPPERVFQAFVDPAVTTRFWFTRSSGRLAPGARVQWDWEMYGASTTVSVREFEENRLIVADWGPEDSPITFKVRFIPWRGDATYVHFTEDGFTGTADEFVARVIDSTAGFTMVLSALKALLEHDVVLTLVQDKAPPEGLEL